MLKEVRKLLPMGRQVAKKLTLLHRNVNELLTILKKRRMNDEFVLSMTNSSNLDECRLC